MKKNKDEVNTVTIRCTKEKEINMIENMMVEISQRVKTIEKRLFGNGVKGIIQKIDDSVEYITALKERDRINGGIESWNRKKLLFWGATLFVVLQLVIELLKIRFGG